MTIVVELTIAQAHSMLTIVQRHCQRTALPVPATVYGSSDTLTQQLLGLLEEEGRDLSTRGDWEGLIFEATHTTLALEDQGPIVSIASEGFRYIKNQTIWDRTSKLPVCGPMNAQEWQATKAMVTSNPRYQFRIRGGKLLVTPAPTAGLTWAFEYVSKYWITDAAGSTYQEYFGADTDLVVLPAELLLMGLRWRWKKEKGLDYAEDFRTYETQVKDAIGRDGGKAILSMSDSRATVRPGIFVSPGSWPT